MDKALPTYSNSASKRTLILFAGIIWFASGFFLVSHGVVYILENSRHIYFHTIAGLVAGIIFYLLFCLTFSKKYTEGIIKSDYDKPGFLSFANIKGYLIMGLLLSAGLYFRKVDFLNQLNLAIVVCMGVCLVITSLKLFLSFVSIRKYAEAETTRHY